jgi:hypothetical protein
VWVMLGATAIAVGLVITAAEMLAGGDRRVHACTCVCMCVAGRPLSRSAVAVARQALRPTPCVCVCVAAGVAASLACSEGWTAPGGASPPLRSLP